LAQKARPKVKPTIGCCLQFLAIKPGRDDAPGKSIQPLSTNHLPAVNRKLDSQPAAIPSDPEIHFVDFVIHFSGLNHPVATSYQKFYHPLFGLQAESSHLAYSFLSLNQSSRPLNDQY
jgi:hypothetical protein